MNATVYMPDFFEPDKPFPIEKFPPKTDKEKDELQEFFDGPAMPEKAVGNLKRVGQTLRKDGAKWVGAYGMCWGSFIFHIITNRRYIDSRCRREGYYSRWFIQ